MSYILNINVKKPLSANDKAFSKYHMAEQAHKTYTWVNSLKTHKWQLVVNHFVNQFNNEATNVKNRILLGKMHG